MRPKFGMKNWGGLELNIPEPPKIDHTVDSLGNSGELGARTPNFQQEDIDKTANLANRLKLNSVLSLSSLKISSSQGNSILNK